MLNLRLKHVIRFLLLLMSGLVIYGCSSQKNNIFSRAFHNTTAHYNAYFLANEQIEEIEKGIWENHQDNYDEILKVLPEIDTNYTNTHKDKLEDVIKKASLPIQRHGNSKWVDDSYILIGKARLYKGNFVDAIETFKYVNTHSDDNDARHQALANLMRTFIAYNEYNNAVAVIDHLKKEQINKDNKRKFFLTSAYLYQLNKDYGNMIQNLTKGILVSKNKHHLARSHFIAGQVYQKFGYDSAAYENYRQCLKSNPIYKMSFHAKLNMAQVTHIVKGQSLKKVRKYFRKLLKDDKNKEFKDKIYFELANFELKQENYDVAIDNYEKSIANSIQNPRQKAYSYLSLGKLYYNHFKNYRLAKDYYDSVMTVMPQDDKQFKDIQQRHQILQDFVKQLTTIETQDSLLQLAKMNDAKLNELLKKEVTEKRDKEKELAKQKAKEKRRSSYRIDEDAPFDAAESQQKGGVWYFYNPSAISSGMNEFKRKWGDRALEDNWRRSVKEQNASIDDREKQAVIAASQDTASVDEAKNTETNTIEEEIEQLKSTIPFEKAEQDSALAKIEEAYYHLGNIYNLKLKEKNNAIESFTTLLNRFPQSEYRAEVLYQLYLIHKKQDPDKAASYKSELMTKFPDTDYAKLAENPDYLKETKIASQRLKKLYNIAYDYYNKGTYDEAQMLVSRALQQYPDNPFTVQLKLLDILITGKVEGEDKYRYQLQQFIDNYPESGLVSYAETLLEASKNLKEKEVRRKGARFITDFEQEHYFILAYQNIENNSETVPEALKKFIKSNYPDGNLKTGSLMLNDEKALVLANKFDNKAEALEFYQSIVKEEAFFYEYASGELNEFVITKDNFQILFKTKDLLSYLNFFEQHYLEETP